MRIYALTLLLMATLNSGLLLGQASTERKTFSRETQVSIDIQAPAEQIWALLTNAAAYPSWNSTVVSIDGQIQLGEKIRLKSTLDEKRTFKLKVKEFVPHTRMVWGDGKGERVYTLSPNASGGIRFEMREKIGGFMFPMYAKYIPSFDDSFTQFARDLKQAAEKA
jgi:uncharacterized protein YndB with AHSA1/START domain